MIQFYFYATPFSEKNGEIVHQTTIDDEVLIYDFRDEKTSDTEDDKLKVVKSNDFLLTFFCKKSLDF